MFYLTFFGQDEYLGLFYKLCTWLIEIQMMSTPTNFLKQFTSQGQARFKSRSGLFMVYVNYIESALPGENMFNLHADSVTSQNQWPKPDVFVRGFKLESTPTSQNQFTKSLVFCVFGCNPEGFRRTKGRKRNKQLL